MIQNFYHESLDHIKELESNFLLLSNDDFTKQAEFVLNSYLSTYNKLKRKLLSLDTVISKEDLFFLEKNRSLFEQLIHSLIENHFFLKKF